MIGDRRVVGIFIKVVVFIAFLSSHIVNIAYNANRFQDIFGRGGFAISAQNSLFYPFLHRNHRHHHCQMNSWQRFEISWYLEHPK